MSAGAGPAWSFRGGEWFGIFGPRATVVLPPTEKDRVAPLWELVDDGAGFDETLDALISAGLRELPGFVLRQRGRRRDPGRDPRRRPVHLAAGTEVVHVVGDDATTWVERSVPGVTRRPDRGRRRRPAPDDVLDGLLDGGLVRLACAEHPPTAAEAASYPAPPTTTA